MIIYQNVWGNRTFREYVATKQIPSSSRRVMKSYLSHLCLWHSPTIPHVPHDWESEFITGRWTDTSPVVSIRLPGAIKLPDTQTSSIHTSGISATPHKPWMHYTHTQHKRLHAREGTSFVLVKENSYRIFLNNKTTTKPCLSGRQWMSACSRKWTWKLNHRR